MGEHNLRPDTRLYREAVRGSLVSAGAPAMYRLQANAQPSESVVDVYGQSYLVQADQVGPGLAFAESALPAWQETMEMRAMKVGPGKAALAPEDRVEIEVLLKDILDQGGLIYPVESVTVEKVWYCTLPSGSITVRAIA